MIVEVGPPIFDPPLLIDASTEAGVERACIVRALADGATVQGAAKILGVSPWIVAKRMRTHKIKRRRLPPLRFLGM